MQGGFLTRAVLWTNGTAMDLGTPPGVDSCAASDINDYGAVIGNCAQSSGPSNDVAFLWQNGSMWSLIDLVHSDIVASVQRVGAINNQGQITGWGLVSPAIVALLLTPIDPPPGDLDIDCRVGIVDLLMLLGNWGPCPSEDCRADLNGDDQVDVLDFWMLILNWGPGG